MGNGDVLNTLKEKGIGMRQNKRRLRSAYCQYYCDPVPVPQADPVPSEVPKPKRQCTVLPMGAYMETTSTNFFSPEEKIRLKKFNHLWSFDHRQKLHEPITMDQAQHANNSHLRTHMHWYCQQALDILSPGNGKELYHNIITIEKQFANQKTQRALNTVVDNLVELCLYASNWEIKRLAFVQLCGALSMK